MSNTKALKTVVYPICYRSFWLCLWFSIIRSTCIMFHECHSMFVDLIIIQSILISSFYIIYPNIILRYIIPSSIYHLYSLSKKVYHFVVTLVLNSNVLWLNEEWNKYLCSLYNLLLYFCQEWNNYVCLLYSLLLYSCYSKKHSDHHFRLHFIRLCIL